MPDQEEYVKYGALCLSCLTTYNESEIGSVFNSQNMQGWEGICKLCGGPTKVGEWDSVIALRNKIKSNPGSQEPKPSEG